MKMFIELRPREVSSCSLWFTITVYVFVCVVLELTVFLLLYDLSSSGSQGIQIKLDSSCVVSDPCERSACSSHLCLKWKPLFLSLKFLNWCSYSFLICIPTSMQDANQASKPTHLAGQLSWLLAMAGKWVSMKIWEANWKLRLYKKVKSYLSLNDF